MKVSLIIPAYNESLIIADTARAALSYLSSHFEDFELIVVDDGSGDGTAAALKDIPDARLRVLGYESNRGKGFAVRTGMLAATGERAYYTDADLAYGLEVIGLAESLFERSGADIVIGSRKLHPDGYAGYPFFRLVASRCFALATAAISRMGYDTQCGFKGFRMDASQKIFSKCATEGFAFDFEVMMLADRVFRFRTEQLPVRIVNHRASKVSLLADSVRMFLRIISIRRAVRKEEPRVRAKRR